MDTELMESSLWYATLKTLEKHMTEIVHQMDAIDDLDKDDIYFMGRGVDEISKDIVTSLDKIAHEAYEAKKMIYGFHLMKSSYSNYCKETEEES